MSVAQRKRKRKTLPAAISDAMPSSIDPMLPTLAKVPFSDPQWLFEPKLDGFRALCFLKDGRVRFISRNRRNLTKRFPELQEISTLIKAQMAIIDGEIVALDRSGKPSFDALRYRPGHGAIVFYAFDLLYFDGQDVTQYPLVGRKEALRRILRKALGDESATRSMLKKKASVSLRNLKRCNSRVWFANERIAFTPPPAPNTGSRSRPQLGALNYRSASRPGASSYDRLRLSLGLGQVERDA